MVVTENVHIVPGVTANPYLLIDKDGLTLIDAGIPGSARRILNYIKRLGYSTRDLIRILVTHSDYDHVGSLAILKRITGARVYASAFEARAMATGRFPRSLKARNPVLKLIFGLAETLGVTTPVLVDEYLSEDRPLPVLNGLQVVDTSGHTPGHVSLFAPRHGILFTGDSVLSVKNRLVGSHGAVTWDQRMADDSVRKQMALDPRIVCAGHGPVMMERLLWPLL